MFRKSERACQDDSKNIYMLGYCKWYQFHKFSQILENLYGLDETFLKIYICWGILGDTNFTNFHQFSPIFTNFHQFSDQFSENIQKILTGLTRRFQKYIYVGVKSRFQFRPFELSKTGGGGGRKLFSRKLPESDLLQMVLFLPWAACPSPSLSLPCISKPASQSVGSQPEIRRSSRQMRSWYP